MFFCEPSLKTFDASFFLNILFSVIVKPIIWQQSHRCEANPLKGFEIHNFLLWNFTVCICKHLSSLAYLSTKDYQLLKNTEERRESE